MRGAIAAQGERKGRVNSIDLPEFPDPDLPPIPDEGDWIAVSATLDDTGATDVTDDLNTYFAGLGDGLAVRFPADKTYRIDGRVLIDGFNGLAIDGNGSTFTTSDDADDYEDTNGFARTHLDFRNCTDLYLVNINVEGPNTTDPQTDPDNAYKATLETQHGFTFRNCLRFLMEECSVQYTWGDNAYIGQIGSEASSQHGTIRNCTLGYAGRQIFAIVAGYDFLFEGNACDKGRRACVDLEPNGPPGVFRVKVRDNTFGYRRLLFFASAGVPVEVSDVVIDNNTVSGNLGIVMQGSYVNSRKNWKITNNVAEGIAGSGSGYSILAKYADGVVCRGNTQPYQAGRNMAMLGINKTTRWMSRDNILTNETDLHDGQYRFRLPLPVLGSDPEGEITDLPTEISTSRVALSTVSVPLALPIGSAVDDVVIIMMGHQGLEFDTPTGWTDLMRGQTEATSVPSLTGQLVIMWKRLTSGDISTGSVTFTMTDGSFSNKSMGYAIAYRDCGDPYGIETEFTGMASASVTCEGPTTTEPSKVLYIAAQRNGNADWFPNDDEVQLVIQHKNAAATGFSSAAGSVDVYGVGKCRDRVWTSDQADQPGALSVCLPYEVQV